MNRIVIAALIFAWIAPASADPDGCRDAITKASAKHAQAVTKVLEKCAERVLAGRLPPSTDCHADPQLGSAATKLEASIARSCCTGATCEPLAAIGWDVGQCPDFESLGCDAPIDGVEDIAGCVACVSVAAASERAAVTLGEAVVAPAGSAARRCEVALGKETARLARSTSKALERCWDARGRGVHANPCPDPGDGRAAPAIARAAAFARVRICAACGGADGACGGGDDVPPGDASALDRCPAVTVPNGPGCGGTIASLDDLATCVACVTSFGTACADRVAVPAFASYPAECNPPPGTCSAGVTCETSLDCPTGYTCRDNGGGTRYCVGAGCSVDGDCGGGGVCRQYCTRAGCGARQCQCPGFGCFGPDELCLDDGGLACRKLCTQDSDCTDPFGLVCVNPGFGFGVCIGQTPCQ